jgi:hypothetical protein
MNNNLITSSLLAGALVVGGATVGLSTATATPAPAPAATAPATAARPLLPSDPARYTQLLVRAWGRGDRPLTAQYATPEVVRRLFAFADPGGPAWAFEGCQGALGTQHCRFVDHDLGVGLDLQGPTEGFLGQQMHVIDDATFSRT